jgi:hypothetical protein
MTIFQRWRAVAAVTLAAAASLALSACILSPGTFDATLDLRRDGRFTFTYNGQIYLLALSKLAEMSSKADGSGGEFVPSTCWDDDDFNERDCTEEEIAEQRSTWEAGAAERKASAEREAEAMRQFLGGIDPADPQAAEELATRLRRQEGWKRVDYRGDGLFEVEFSISSTMGHDFVFPTIERFPMVNSFVLANARQGGTVRVEAPGFAAQAGGSSFPGMMVGLAALGSASSGEENPLAGIPEMDGTFRVVTDGQILANNTDEGPRPSPQGQVLEWRVNKRTTTAPMALIQLGG